MNLVLYRKYRPQTFADVVGQEHVVKTVTSAIAHNEFSHAYLFAGPRGTGKTTIARLIAKSLNCENRKNGKYEPCEKCLSCGEISKGISLDVIEIDAASNRGIDDIRQLKENIRFSPASSKFKIYIIDEVHMLTKEAFNALLKTLEEPPSHAVFVMATTELGKVIPTIISRSQKFELRKLRRNEIKKRLYFLSKQEGKEIDDKILDIVTTRAAGSIRDAESMLGQIFALDALNFDDARILLGFADFSEISRFVSFIGDSRKKECLEFISDLSSKGADPEEFVKNVLNYIRFAMYLKIDEALADIVSREVSQEELSELKSITSKFNIEKLQKASRLFLEASGNIKYSPIPELPIELAVVEILNS